MNASHEVEARLCGHAEIDLGCADCWEWSQAYDWDSHCSRPWAYELMGAPRRAYRGRPSASDDEDTYADLRLARVRAALARPPGLAGPREFAVPAGQLAGLRYHLMVRGGPPVEPIANALWHMLVSDQRLDDLTTHVVVRAGLWVGECE